MYSIQEQFKTDALAQINSRVNDAQIIAGNILDLGREIGVLNIRTTRASTESLAGAVQKLFSASNPGEFMQLAASVMQPDMQLWTSYVEQLQNIASKASLPTRTPPMSAASSQAPEAAPEVTWPKAETTTPEASPETALSENAPVISEQAQLEAAVEPVPAAPPPAAVPYAAALEEDSAETPPAVAATPPETVEAIKEVAGAMTGANKAPPAVMAASTLPPQEPVVPEITVVRKTAAGRQGHKPAAPSTPKKAAAPVRSAPNRSRKG